MATKSSRTQEPPRHIDIPERKSIITKICSDPSSIDEALAQFFHDDPLAPFTPIPKRENRNKTTLAEHLFDWLEDYTSRPVTPELHWSADPTKPPLYYKSCLVWAIALGRALSIAWKTRQRIFSEKHARTQAILDSWPYPIAKRIIDYIEAHATAINEITQRLWDAARVVFVQALFSFEPSTGARYAAAVVLLTASVAIQQGMQPERRNARAEFIGRGQLWVWWDGALDPRTADVEWKWYMLMNKLAGTRNLPRHNTDGPHMRAMINMSEMGPATERLMYPQDTGEYISHEALVALDLARQHCFGTADPVPVGLPPQFVVNPMRRDLTCREVLKIRHFAAQWTGTSEGVESDRDG